MQKSQQVTEFKSSKTWLSLLLFFVIFASFEAFISSCASRSSPSGGDKDTLAPQLDTSFPPNQTIYFKSDKIRLKFEEYINLKSPQQQIRISPLLPDDLEIIGKGKEVEIKGLDSLRENTTYIISFGSAISDLTEGNVNKEFKYVFSTGSYIDSLTLEGRINDAYSGEASKDLLVLLYDVSRNLKRDSMLYKNRPDYYSFSDELGSFKMTNMRSGKYLLAAFADKEGDFKLNASKVKMAFWTDTIDLEPDSTYAYQLYSFDPIPDFRFINARHASFGEINFNFSAPAKDFRVEALDVPLDSGFFKFSQERDTLYYRFRFQRDSIRFKLNYDSLFVDSIISIRLRDYDEPKLKLTAPAKEIRKNDTVFVYANLEIEKWFADSTAFYGPKDTLVKLPQGDSSSKRRWYYLPPHTGDFSVIFKKGAAQHSASNRLKDSLRFDFDLKAGEDLGSLKFNVQADSGVAFVLQVLDADDKPFRALAFYDNITLDLKNQLPQKFKAYLIRDSNGDGKWTTGSFEDKRQPELRIPYLEELEIRANWDLDLDWIYQSEAINN